MTIAQEIQASEKAMSFDPKALNYSINLGFASPYPAGFFEFAIVGEQDQKREAVPKILKLFEANNAGIVSISFSNHRSVDEFTMNIVCDVNTARCAPDELLIRVNKLKYVKVAEISELDGRVFGRFSFPLTFFGEVRALAIDAKRFVHLSQELVKTSGNKAKEALFQNGCIEGRAIIAALGGKLGERAQDKQFLFENAKALLQTAGWGRLFFNPEGADLYKVTINEPPSDANESAVTGNYFLHGLVAGILEPFLKNGVHLSMIREGYEVEKKDLVLYYMDKAAIKELASSEEDDEVRETEREQMKKERQVARLAPPNRPVVNSNVSKKPSNVELKKPDETVTKVKEIIKSINQVQEENKGGIEEEPATPVLPSENSQSFEQRRQNHLLVQGEIIGSGIQIIQPPAKSSQLKRKKKPLTQDNSSEYTSTEEESF